MPTAGFVGIGIMGEPMAMRLLDQHPLIVFNRTRGRTQGLAERGAVVANSLKDVGQSCSLVFLMLSDDQAVQRVVEGPEGLSQSLRPGSIIVDHSTISPKTTRALAERCAAIGVTWLDAPVTGGDGGARSGTLTIMVGGSDRGFERVLPYLKLMGEHIVHVGGVGQGQTLKLVANLVSGITLMAASEGLQLGLQLGLALPDLSLVLQHSSASSYEVTKVIDRVSRQDYQAGFSVKNRYKDLELAREMAQQAGFALDLGLAGERAFKEHLDAGFEFEDEASYIKRWTESE